MNKKWIASLACVCLLASSFTAAVAEGMRGLPPVRVHVIPARGGVGRAAEQD